MGSSYAPVETVQIAPHPHPTQPYLPPFTQYEAELDGLLFHMGVGLGNVGAAPAEGVCQDWGHFDAMIHEGLEAVV